MCLGIMDRDGTLRCVAILARSALECGDKHDLLVFYHHVFGDGRVQWVDQIEVGILKTYFCGVEGGDGDCSTWCTSRVRISHNHPIGRCRAAGLVVVVGGTPFLFVGGGVMMGGDGRDVMRGGDGRDVTVGGDIRCLMYNPTTPTRDWALTFRAFS